MRVLTSLRHAWLLMLPLLLVLMALLLVVAWNTHMHPDESLAYQFTRFGIPYAVNYLATQDVHPPLWFSFFWVWRQLVGDGEFAARMQALLFSLITLALAYRIGRDWFGRARAGLFAAAILGASAYFLDYALEIRPYALVMLLAALSMWLFARWLARGTWRLALAYGVVTAIMLYVHYFVAFLIIVQIVYFVLRRPSRCLLRQGLGAGALALLLWSPWLPSVVNQISLLRQLAQQAGNSYGLGIGTPATTQATDLETLARLLQVATNGQPLLYALVLLLGVALVRRKSRYGLALAWALGVPAVALALNTVAAVYTQRYVAYLAVGLALAAAAALAALKPAIPCTLALAGFLALNLIFVPAWLPVRVPYRDVFGQVSEVGKAGDALLIVPAKTYDQFLDWQVQQYIAPDLRAGVTTDAPAAQQARRVWFLTGDPFSPAVQTSFAALEASHPLQQVIGQCPEVGWCYLAQLMEAPPLTEPVRFGANIDFWGIDVDSVTPAAIRTRLWWRVASAPALDYSISLRWVDANGAVVGQTDGPINHYGAEIVQTSQLQPGKIYIDWRSIEYDPSVPAGRYHLELVIYQSWDGQRLPLAGGADALTLWTLDVD